jgi:hypothetical protein
MNKVSMDAMNKGWALGFGTQVGSADADILCAVARHEGDEGPVGLIRKRPTFDHLGEIINFFPFGLAMRSAH